MHHLVFFLFLGGLELHALIGDRMICPCTFTIAILNWTELRVILEVKKREGVCFARMDHVLSLDGLFIRPNQSFLLRGQTIRYSPTIDS